MMYTVVKHTNAQHFKIQLCYRIQQYMLAMFTPLLYVVMISLSVEYFLHAMRNNPCGSGSPSKILPIFNINTLHRRKSMKKNHPISFQLYNMTTLYNS